MVVAKWSGKGGPCVAVEQLAPRDESEVRHAPHLSVPTESFVTDTGCVPTVEERACKGANCVP
jgi:hypothetical protein